MQEKGVPSRTRTSRTRTTSTAWRAMRTSLTGRARRATSSSSRTTTPRSRTSSRDSHPTASTSSNTLFVITVDEGDHFVGVAEGGLRRRERTVRLDEPGRRAQLEHRHAGAASISLSFRSVPPPQGPNTFTVHGDDAPPFYLAKKGMGGGALGQTDPIRATSSGPSRASPRRTRTPA